jgi:hypothetical protein
MRHREAIHTLLVSALFGALVWALSPHITGHKEPWDSAGYYYPLAILVAGFLSGLGSPPIRLAFYFGSILGQLIFVLVFLATGPLILVGVLIMSIVAVAFLLAALLGSYLRARATAMFQKHSS